VVRGALTFGIPSLLITAITLSLRDDPLEL